MVFQIRIADQVVEIHSLCGTVRSVSKAYLLPERENPSIVVTIQDQDILRELEEMWNAAKRLGLPVPIVGEGYCESLAVLRKVADAMPRFDTFLMHGAVVATEGVGYMFTANSGVGKSTRARLWLEEYPGSTVVNGDKPLIRITEDGVFACGTPWCGKEGWNTNTIVPLKAVFLLDRAEDETDTVEEMTMDQAFPTLLRQTHRPSDAAMAAKTVRLLNSLNGKVKFYRFRSHPNTEAVRLAFEAVKQDLRYC